MSLEAALRRDDEAVFLDESENVHYHVTKTGAVTAKSVALVTLPHDHKLRNLDCVVYCDKDLKAEEMGPAEITYGLRCVHLGALLCELRAA
jgi:hypothetical protein